MKKIFKRLALLFCPVQYKKIYWESILKGCKIPFLMEYKRFRDEEKIIRYYPYKPGDVK